MKENIIVTGLTDEVLDAMLSQDGMIEFSYLTSQLRDLDGELHDDVNNIIQAIHATTLRSEVEPNLLLNTLTQALTMIIYLLINPNREGITEAQVNAGQQQVLDAIIQSLPELLALHNTQLPIYQQAIDEAVAQREQPTETQHQEHKHG